MTDMMDREDRDRLIQILAELGALRSDISEIKAEQKVSRADSIRLSLVESRVDSIELREKERDGKYVTQLEYEPIRRIFWIVVGAVVAVIVTAIVGLILVV